MFSIKPVLGPHEFGLRSWLGAQGGSQISTGREHFAGGRAVFLTLSKGLEAWLGAQVGSQISTGREDSVGDSAVLPMLSEGLAIELSDFEAENAMLNGDCLWQVVFILIGGVPTILEVRCIFFFMSHGWILLQGSISTNLFGPMRHQVDLRKVEVGI